MPIARATPSAVTATLIVALLGGCSLFPPPDVPLKTRERAPLGAAYAGVGLPTLQLFGDASAASGSQVWVKSDRGRTFSPVWPWGWKARFNPDLEIVDCKGRVVLREGERFDAGGVLGEGEEIGIIEINGELVDQRCAGP